MTAVHLEWQIALKSLMCMQESRIFVCIGRLQEQFRAFENTVCIGSHNSHAFHRFFTRFLHGKTLSRFYHYEHLSTSRYEYTNLHNPWAGGMSHNFTLFPKKSWIRSLDLLGKKKKVKENLGQQLPSLPEVMEEVFWSLANGILMISRIMC